LVRPDFLFWQRFVRQSFGGGADQIKMLLRRIHSPSQHEEEERHKRGEGDKSSQRLPDAARD